MARNQKKTCIYIYTLEVQIAIFLYLGFWTIIFKRKGVYHHSKKIFFLRWWLPLPGFMTLYELSTPSTFPTFIQKRIFDIGSTRPNDADVTKWRLKKRGFATRKVQIILLVIAVWGGETKFQTCLHFLSSAWNGHLFINGWLSIGWWFQIFI